MKPSVLEPDSPFTRRVGRDTVRTSESLLRGVRPPDADESVLGACAEYPRLLPHPQLIQEDAPLQMVLVVADPSGNEVEADRIDQ
jgi:hypothetical protein